MKEFILYIKNIIQLLLSSSSGWEDIFKSKPKLPLLLSGMMFPSFLIASLSVFFQFVYEKGLSITDVIISAAIIFVSYFVSYVFSRSFFCSKVKKLADKLYDKEKSEIVIVYILTLLALSTVICNVLPMSMGFPYLFPLIITLIVWKAAPSLSIPQDKDVAFDFAAFYTLTLIPIAIQSLFYWVLTQ